MLGLQRLVWGSLLANECQLFSSAQEIICSLASHIQRRKCLIVYILKRSKPSVNHLKMSMDANLLTVNHDSNRMVSI